MEITIPHNYDPRSYQLPLLAAMDSGYKRAFCVWHRRAGKDKTLINLITKKMTERVGVYYYFFPEYKQGRKIIWDGVDGSGQKFIDHFPKEFIANKNDQEMKIKAINGSLFQIVGTDNYDSIRGTNPVGCVFSEFAFQNPMAWDVVRPILKENGGWAVFNTTPNGKNHAYDMAKMAEVNEKWFFELLDVTRTKRPDGTPVITDEMIQEERMSGMSEEMIQQEYYCSFDIGAIGSIYGDEMQKAYKEERITDLPFYNDRYIDIFFDLGWNDMMTMWFMQKMGEKFNFINYHEENNKKLDFYFSYIRDYIEQKRGKLGLIHLPHDAKKHELITGKTIQQEFQREFGAHKINLIPQTSSIVTDIQQVRKVFPRCYFDVSACKQGIRCLEGYQYEYDPLSKVFKKNPKHDWASNGADSFRYFAMSVLDDRQTFVPKYLQKKQRRETISGY